MSGHLPELQAGDAATATNRDEGTFPLSDHPLELGLGDAATMANRDGRTSPRIPTTVSVPNHGEESEGTGSQLPTHAKSELPTTAPQHHGGEPQHPSGGSNLSSINENDEEHPCQHNEVIYHASSPQDDRDLEKGEPSATLPLRPSATASQDSEEGHGETTEAAGPKVAGQRHSLVQFLKSELGEIKYREYVMGHGNAVHRSFLVRRFISNIATRSSIKETWKPLRYLATVSQHLVSRWVHSDYRKHFETFHPLLYDGTAVHLLQNIGNPSDRWIDETLGGSLGLDPGFLLEHLALVCDGTRAKPSLSSSKRQQCTSAWHVHAVLSDQPMLQFGPWSTSAPPEMAGVAIMSFQQTRQGSFLVLLNMKTHVPLGERFAESFRARETSKGVAWSKQRYFLARAALNIFTVLSTIAGILDLLLMFYPGPFWWLFTILFLLGVRPINPKTIDRYGEVAIEWPNIKRMYLGYKLRPPHPPVFGFLKEWLSDPVHIKMLTYMTSHLEPGSSAYKAAEDRCIWLLNRADWRHEVRRLSTESETLERQVVERSNFNTLKRLIQCRKTTKRVKDGIKKFRSYSPATTIDWAPVIQSWADQQQARSDQQRQQQDQKSPEQDQEVRAATQGMHVSPELHQSHTHFFPTLQAERNPIELLYWKTRTEKTWEPEELANLTLEHVEDTLSRSLSLLQDAIAVQTSDRALWLALIATFYFPATLATGVFGMNLSLIDGKPYWWAIVLCAIMFVPNLGFLIYVFGRR